MIKQETLTLIFLNELYGRHGIYGDKVSYIKSMFNEEDLSFLCSFRYKLNKDNFIICQIQVKLLQAEGTNVGYRLVHIKPTRRYSGAGYDMKYTKTIYFCPELRTDNTMDELITRGTDRFYPLLKRLKDKCNAKSGKR